MSNTGIIPLDQLPSARPAPGSGGPGPGGTSAPAGIIPLDQLPSSAQTPSDGGGLGGFLQSAEPALAGAMGQYLPPGIATSAAPVLAGGLKRVGGMAGTVLDLISRPATKPGSTATVPGSPADKGFQHMQDAAQWLHKGATPEGFWENVGATGTDIVAMLGTDGLLGLAGEAAAGTEAGGTVMGAIKNLESAQQVGKFLTAHPRIAGLIGIGLKASKDAAMMGGQTYLATEDPAQAAHAAEVGGVLGTAMGLAPEALGAVARGPIGRWLQKVSPKAANIFDTSIPALHDQLTAGGWTTDVGAVGYPEFAEAQQKGAGEAIGKMTGQATDKALENINAVPSFKADIPQMPGEYEQTKAGWVEKPQQPYTFESSNPAEARQVRSELEDQMNAPEFKRLPAERQTAIKQAAEDLDHQLTISQIGAPRQFEIAQPTSSLKTPGQAAEQLRATAQSGYQKLDEVSGGTFSRFRNQAKKAMSVLANPHNGDEAAQAASESLDEANQGMNDLFDQYAGHSDISSQYYAKMKTAWRYSKTLDNLHARLERMTNGITIEESERGAQRVMTGNTRELSRWLESTNELGSRTNREDVEELIGQAGVDNLKNLTNLLAKADTARATDGVLRNVAGQLSRDIKKGAVVGGVVGKVLGTGWAMGAGLGGAAGASVTGMRALLRYAYTNPKFGEMVAYAAKSDVNPQVYAPLMSRMIMVPLQEVGQSEQQPQQKEETPQ